MQISSVPVPAVYREESADFRFFQKWFELALSKIQYDTEEFFDLFDPLRCPEDLLWMLGDTMGYKYDSRMTPAFNRLVLVYFMSMIRLKGSKDGLTLAAQVNLDQFKLQQLAEENHILNNRLEDTSIPSNAIYVQPHPDKGYIDLVYFSDKCPVDACTEYTRPVGMYLVPHAGVRKDIKDKISIDARLTNTEDLNVSLGSTHVGHYTQNDYSRMQRVDPSDLSGTYSQSVQDTQGLSREQIRAGIQPSYLKDRRAKVWYRNPKYEDKVGKDYGINPGYRALYSLQFANGETTTRSLLSSVRGVTNVQADDVSVYDTDTHEVYDNNYYITQENNRLAALEYVPPRSMGTMGDAMTVLPDDDTSEDS